MKLLEHHSSEILQDLHDWAKDHAQTYPDLFEVLPIDPDRYQHQAIHHHTVESTPLPPEVIDSIANDVDPRYDAISEAVEENAQGLNLIGEILDSKHNVVLGTDHAELIDIALLLAKVKTSLSHRGYEFDTGLIVNKMVAFLGVKLKDGVIPATDLLGMALEEVYLNIPSSLTGKQKMTSPRKVITGYNQMLMERGIERRLKQSQKIGRAMLLGSAMSGTVNKKLDADLFRTGDYGVEIQDELLGSTYVIGRASLGVLRFTTHALSVMASSNLDHDDVRVKISDTPISISSEAKLTKAMEQTALLQRECDPDAFYIYDSQGNLPIKR